MMSNIEQLIPQRAPIVMVDKLLEADGDEALTSLTITSSNFFLADDGQLEATGLVEHIAQSASALAGHQALLAGQTEPPVGYIGEVKKFHCYQRPAIGDELHTKVVLGAAIGGVRIVTGETRVGDILVADTQMKIYIKE